MLLLLAQANLHHDYTVHPTLATTGSRPHHKRAVEVYRNDFFRRLCYIYIYTYEAGKRCAVLQLLLRGTGGGPV